MTRTTKILIAPLSVLYYDESTTMKVVQVAALFVLFALAMTGSVHAQGGYGAAEYVSFSGASNVKDGSIIVRRQSRYELSTEPYSKDLEGVVSLTPSIEIAPVNKSADQIPLVQSGQVQVRVNGENGAVKSGDLLTSSSTPGVAMKATRSGFVLGAAQADFTPSDTQQEGLIPVMVSIKFAFSDDSPASERVVSRLMSVVSLNTISFVEEPVKSLKYTAAVLAVLGSLAVSFFTFGRVAYKGVEAIGRNPLAKNSITFSVVLNASLALGLAVAGVIAAYVIVTW